MLIKQVFAYSVIASFFIFVHVQAGNTDDLTVEKYLGRWYRIAATVYSVPPTECDILDITRGDAGNNTFNEIYEARLAGNQLRMNIHGKIEGSTISIAYLLFRGLVEEDYTCESINNGQELIAFRKNCLYDIQLISRNITASNEANERYRYLTEAQGREFIEINHSGCPDDND